MTTHAHDPGHVPTSAHTETEHLAHPVSPRVLLGVYFALVLLTIATVSVTYIDIGPFNIWLALFIAVLKAGLVALFFMHLFWDSPFNGIILIGALFFVALFLGIAILDAKEYQINLFPPGVNSSTAQ
jgi:cytochrome c oxidase subunit 4